jgi:predicted metal-dependent peptidase
MDRLLRSGHDPGDETGEKVVVSHALRSLYRPPWEMALQRWMEAVAPGPRSYTRPSRRGADRTDVVLAGRTREGWRLHLVLDTSGSMGGTFPPILGAIASFCESVNVAQIRLLQCDVEVTADQTLTAEELYAFEIVGLGGTSLSPAMLRLAEDPEVEATIIITDGYLRRSDYPRAAPPYALLWVLTDPDSDFSPDYGQVIYLDPGAIQP